MDERDIEAYLRKRVEAAGGFHRNVTYQGRSGSPDDWCFLPGGRLVIVECMQPGERLSPEQALEITRLEQAGQEVYVVQSFEEVDEIMDERDIEAYLRKRVEAAGGFHRKVTYQGRSGSPDDWCFLPNGRLVIVECKQPGERLSPEQALEITVLEQAGQEVHIVRSVEEVDDIFE